MALVTFKLAFYQKTTNYDQNLEMSLYMTRLSSPRIWNTKHSFLNIKEWDYMLYSAIQNSRRTRIHTPLHKCEVRNIDNVTEFLIIHGNSAWLQIAFILPEWCVKYREGFYFHGSLYCTPQKLVVQFPCENGKQYTRRTFC